MRRQLPLKNSLLFIVPKRRGHATPLQGHTGNRKVSLETDGLVLKINIVCAQPSFLTERPGLENKDYSEQTHPY